MRETHFIANSRRLAIAVFAGLIATITLVTNGQAQIEVRNGMTGRLRRMPLCSFMPPEDSYYQFLLDGRWVCSAAGVPCSWPYDHLDRPSEEQYSIHPNRSMNYDLTLEWPDGTLLQGNWGMSCLRNPLNQNYDTVIGADSTPLPVTPWKPGEEIRLVPMLLARVSGGYVEHIRPAYVQGTIRLSRNWVWMRYMDDWNDKLQLVIQVLNSEGWQDVIASSPLRTDGTQRTYTVEGYVPELTDVRMEVRSEHDENVAVQLGYGYTVTDANLFVETCVPDLGNPGECLGCSVGGTSSDVASTWGPIAAALLLVLLRVMRRRRPVQ